MHKIVVVGGPAHWQAKCSCKWKSELGSKTDAYAAELVHSREVRKAQAGLRRIPSLRQERNWYLEQAVNYTNTAEERALWQRLADELEPRIGGEPDVDQLPLW